MRKLERVKDLRIARYIGEIKTLYLQHKATHPQIIEQMQLLREVFIEHEQPTLVKSLRLAYEHLEKFGDYKIEYWGHDESLSEDGEALAAAASEISAFEYFLDLLANPSNKYNRDEIKEVNLLLKDSLND